MERLSSPPNSGWRINSTCVISSFSVTHSQSASRSCIINVLTSVSEWESAPENFCDQKKGVMDTRLTSDDQLGGLCCIVDGCLRHAGVAPGVLQLGILDEQRAA